MNQQSTRALTAYYSQKNNNNNNNKLNNNNNKTTSLREPPPLLLPKPSPELPIRRKKQQQTSQSPPHHSFKQTLHASLSQDGLELGQRRLNQYLLLRTIGKGSFGNVELAQDTSSFRIETTETQGKLFAIKEYSKSRMRKRARQLKHHHHPTRIKARTVDDDNSLHLSESELNSSEGIRLVRKEVAIMKKLAHPNIVSLLEVIDTDQDSLFFGQSLTKHTYTYTYVVIVVVDR
jgi:[calcium/calmodulin-dependent protein kinase] kinase